MNQYDENATVRKEQQSIKLQHEKAIKEAERANMVKVEKERLVEGQRNEERRLADERRVREAKLQERLRKENERRKKEQRKKYSIAGQGNDIVTQSVRIAEQSVQMLYDDTKNIIRMSKELLQKRAEEKKLTEGECNKIIKTYEMLKSNLNQLDKANKSLEVVKDKKVIEKFQTSKQALEKNICETLDIKKGNPNFLQSKQMIEKSFNEKIHKGFTEFEAKADIAKGRLREIREEKRMNVSHRGAGIGSRTALAHKSKATAPKVKARGV